MVAVSCKQEFMSADGAEFSVCVGGAWQKVVWHALLVANYRPTSGHPHSWWPRLVITYGCDMLGSHLQNVHPLGVNRLW